MALYENKITVKGFLGKDAETVSTGSQKNFVLLSIATKSGYKDKQSKEWVNHTEWHRIVAFGKPADYAKGLRKGDYVEVEGELHSTEFEREVGKDRNKIKVTFRDKEIRAALVKKLDPPAKGENLDAEAPADRSSSAGWNTDSITEDDAA